MPKVIILSGIPGSGKSTWSTWYVQHNWKSAIVSRDTIRENYFTHPYIYTKTNEAKVTEIYIQQLTKLLSEGWDVIIDNTHAAQHWIEKTIKDVQRINAEYEQFYTYKIYVKFFDIWYWRARFRVWRRFKKTGKVVPKGVLKCMYNSYTQIKKEQFKEYIL